MKILGTKHRLQLYYIYHDDAAYREEVAGASDEKVDAAELEKLKDLYNGINDKSLSITDAAESPELTKLTRCLLRYRDLLSEFERSPSAKLWLQYIEYVSNYSYALKEPGTGICISLQLDKC